MRVVTDCPSYYTYHGSYNVGTNPECVTWIVFPTIIPIQSSQVSYLIRVVYIKCIDIIKIRLKHFSIIFYIYRY